MEVGLTPDERDLPGPSRPQLFDDSERFLGRQLGLTRDRRPRTAVRAPLITRKRELPDDVPGVGLTHHGEPSRGSRCGPMRHPASVGFDPPSLPASGYWPLSGMYTGPYSTTVCGEAPHAAPPIPTMAPSVHAPSAATAAFDNDNAGNRRKRPNRQQTAARRALRKLSHAEPSRALPLPVHDNRGQPWLDVFRARCQERGSHLRPSQRGSQQAPRTKVLVPAPRRGARGVETPTQKR